MSELQMVETLLIGDTHADVDGYFSLIFQAERARGRALPSIHVGDYGFGSLSPGEERQVERFHRSNPRHCFLRGNHDRPSLIQGAPGYLNDGLICGSVLFLGGADGALRNWQTEISPDRMAEISTRLSHLGKLPTVVISHDGPQEAAELLFADRGLGGGPLAVSRTRAFLSEILALIHPQLWIFGHWHHAWAAQIGDTHFRALGFAEALTVPLPWIPGDLGK
jgi:hypothetical protein